ncbi:MAG: NUDIX domain-containing protein [bacterium]|nr:NUDIX domain-containing protein [bacterium]
MKIYRYCPLCKAELTTRQAGGRERPACACGYVQWGNPVPAAGVCVLDEGKVLWVRRAENPKKGLWSLPSGFQEWEEDIRDCARREMREETGLTVKLDGLLGVYSAFDDPRNNALLVVFLATETGGELVAGDDASEARWFPLEAPPEEIAWESHRQALADLAALVAGRRQ